MMPSPYLNSDTKGIRDSLDIKVVGRAHRRVERSTGHNSMEPSRACGKGCSRNRALHMSFGGIARIKAK